MKYLFVVGCPRSGTTWLAWLLAQHPETVMSLHTGFFESLAKSLLWVDRRTGFGNRVMSRSAGTDDEVVRSLTDIVEPRELYAACRPLAETLFHGIARANPSASWVVEKTPENLLHSELVREVLPNARFLHLVRDPRAVYASMKAAGKAWAYPGDLASSPIAFVRAFWDVYQEAGDRLEGEDEIYRVVRYEDLLEDGAGQLGEIFDWIGLPSDRELCEGAVEASSIDRMRSKLAAPKGFFRTGRAEGWRQELSRWEIRAIEHLARDRMESFGYHCSTPRSGRAPLRLRLSDGIARAGHQLVSGPLGRPLARLIGRARRSAETVRAINLASQKD